MAEIIREEIRATIVIGTVEVKTPYIKSFTIDRRRGQMVSSFSAMVEVPVTELRTTTEAMDTAGRGITISAGTKDNEKLLFTGEIKTVNISPSWDKPDYFVLNLGGTDFMGRLENRTYSRRIKWTSAGMWAKITNIKETQNKKTARAFDRKKLARNTGRLLPTPDLGDGEHSPYVYARDLSKIDPYGKIVNRTDIGKQTALTERDFTVSYVSS